MSLNHDGKDDKTLNMMDFNFLPSFQIELLDNSKIVKKVIDEDDDFDIYDHKIEMDNFPTINYDKLQ